MQRSGQREDAMEHFDVIIVGAGLSGIGAAHHLQRRCPGKRYLILEGREALGGTWDLFRYPGIRSDSDMYTLGYAFRPWTAAKAIADGPSILNYVRDTAREGGIEPHIRFRHLVRRAAWSSADARWTVEAEHDGATVSFTCGFLFMCSGYYSYAEGHRPEFPGEEAFKGTWVQPQFWPRDLDYAGKQVVVIGSGATAVTLVPEMAKDAAHVAMLQRSPTYMVSRPSEDGLANALRKLLPAKLAYALIRWRNVSMQMLFFNLARKRPARTKERLIGMVRDELGEDYDVGTHFTPRYNPWDQRLCLVPDSDMFLALKEGRASVVTDEIAGFSAGGIKLKSGAELPADIIVAATGLKLNCAGDVAFSIDGRPADMAKTMTYKGMFFSDTPNFALAFGYTNASWTLKCDLTCEYVCRVLNHMDATGADYFVVPRDPSVPEAPFLNLDSGYIKRAAGVIPRQGATKPWRLNQNYALDLMSLKFGKLDDGVIQFRKAGAAQPAKEPLPSLEQAAA
jgi:monooxygenase